MKIFFKEIPEITVDRNWTGSQMRDYCIKYNFYTGGTNEAYEEMLEYVECTKPTTDNIFKVAYDIFKHTPELNEDTDYSLEDHIAGLMHGIATDVVYECYTVGDFDI